MLIFRFSPVFFGQSKTNNNNIKPSIYKLRVSCDPFCALNSQVRYPPQPKRTPFLPHILLFCPCFNCSNAATSNTFSCVATTTASIYHHMLLSDMGFSPHGPSAVHSLSVNARVGSEISMLLKSDIPPLSLLLRPLPPRHLPLLLPYPRPHPRPRLSKRPRPQPLLFAEYI